MLMRSVLEAFLCLGKTALTFRSSSSQDSEASKGKKTDEERTSVELRPMQQEAKPLLESGATTHTSAPVDGILRSRILGGQQRARATTVWFDEVQEVEDEGDRAFNRRRRPIFERALKFHTFSADERKRMDAYESIDYYEPQSLIYKDHLRIVRRERRWVKWAVYVAIGVVVGVWACLLFQTLDLLADTKHNLVQSVVNARTEDLSGTAVAMTRGGIPVSAFFYGFAVYTIWAAVAALLSSLCCLLMPSAAGSGVPDVMAYLNGVMFPRIFNIRNLIAKTLSCIFAVSSGLPVGAEGPMIHIGSLIGAGLPTGRSRTLQCSATPLLSMFRNSKDHRDFISAGAACGVTAAFSSPIGGLLFVMEEVATFFPVKLAWMVFIASLSSMFVIQIFNTYVQSWGQSPFAPPDGNLADEAIAMFRVQFTNVPNIPLNLLTFVPTVVAGLALGALSVGFVLGNARINRLRNRYIVPKPLLRVLEPAVFVFVYTSCCYLLPLLFECQTVPPFVAANMQELNFNLWTCFCSDPATQYHPLGTLTLTNAYNVIRVLFSRHTLDLVPWHSLVILQLLYTCGAMYAGGMFMSIGIVIPTLLMGACGGRLIGLMFGNVAWADPGVVALIGAAAYFGGLSRLTFSLTVIMMELTNDLTHMSCLMVGIIVAKTFADRFCHSLYHAILESKCVPFLPTDNRMHKLDTFCAKDIMTAPVVTLKTVDSFQRVVDVLQDTSHHCFPVVSVTDEQSYRGLLQRKQMELLLWFIYFRDTSESRIFNTSTAMKSHASYTDLKETQERVFWGRLPPIPPIHELPVETLESFIDLNPYVDLSAYYVRDVMSVSRTYSIFQNMGLRHLPVLNRRNQVVGIISRKNFVGDRMQERIDEAAVRAKDAQREAAIRKRKKAMEG